MGHCLTQEVQGARNLSPTAKGSCEGLWYPALILCFSHGFCNPQTRRLTPHVLHCQDPGFQSQNWATVWAGTELAAGVFVCLFVCLFSYPSGAWNPSETEPFTPLERGLKPGSQEVSLSGSHSHGDQQAKNHLLEILTVSTEV